MATQTNGNIQASVSWLQNDTKKVTTIYDSGAVSINTPFSTGSGVQQINSAWHNQYTLPSGGQISLDLTSLSQTILGETVSKTFTNVKSIIVKNSSTIDGAYVRIDATGSYGFTGPFAGQTGRLAIYGQGAGVLAYPKGGWPVSGSLKELQITDSGYGCTVEIALVGVTG